MLATAPGCELDVERGPDWLLVKVKSLDCDSTNPPPLADEVWSLSQRHFVYRVVLDLHGVEILNSCLIGQLILLYKRIREHDGVMRLCGLSPYNRRVMDTCRLSDCFVCYASARDAVMGGWRPVQPR